jgi:hypothetical protein
MLRERIATRLKKPQSKNPSKKIRSRNAAGTHRHPIKKFPQSQILQKNSVPATLRERIATRLKKTPIKKSFKKIRSRNAAGTHRHSIKKFPQTQILQKIFFPATLREQNT